VTDEQTDTGRQQRPRLRMASRGKNRFLLSSQATLHAGAYRLKHADPIVLHKS